jgi:hypothetical protein
LLKPIFLDTCIFFECIEDPRKITIINHAVNLEYIISTSITVLGEAMDQIREHEDRDRYISPFMSLLDEWGVWTYYPDQIFARVCNCLANREIDFRVEKTDLVHIGYAISNDCGYFLTSDKNLIKYKIPPQLERAGFFRPEALTLEEFKDRL